MSTFILLTFKFEITRNFHTKKSEHFQQYFCKWTSPTEWNSNYKMNHRRIERVILSLDYL